MEVVIKSFLGVFFTLVVVFMGVNVNTASSQACAANMFAADCVSKIENANYAESVIEACRQDAKNRGYEFSVETYQPEGTKVTNYGVLCLAYQFEMPLLKSKEKHVITSDIR